jgi:Carboxypeptidase regulatory-like domain
VEQSKIVAGSVVAGYLIGPDRKPIAGASVMFASGPCALPDIAQVTDAKGAFALAAPMKGTYRLVINAPGFPAVEQDVEVTDRAKSPIEVKVRESL